MLDRAAPEQIPAPAPKQAAVPARTDTISAGPGVALKMVVGSSTDPAEVEADRIASVVVSRIAQSSVQPAHVVEDDRQATSPEFGGGDAPHDGDDPIGRRTVPGIGVGGFSKIRRSTAAPVAGERPIGAEGGDAPTEVTSRIQSAKGRGSGLEPGVRSDMEAAFGHDLGDVRLHTDSESASLSRQLGAQAFTTGSDIFFDRGKYQPHTDGGKHLLAHELTHTVQQTGSISRIRRSTALPALDIARDTGGGVRRLAYNQDPTTWGPPAGINRRRSGEGVVGVFFANDAGAVFAPGTVVIKPLGSSGEIEFANQFLQEGMGFDVPDTISYDIGSPEGIALQAVLTAPGVTHLKSATEAADQIAVSNKIMVMSIVEGQSIQTLGDADALQFLQNAPALEQVGKLMISDAFLGNTDRLVGPKANLGNFFYAVANVLHTGKITTIDNEASFVAATRKANGSLDGEMVTKAFYLEQLTTAVGQDYFINKFLQRMTAAHAANPLTSAELVNNHAGIVANVRNGIIQGLQDIGAVFTNNMDLVRAMGDYVDGFSGAKLNVDEGKATAEFTKQLAGGTAAATAVDNMSTYMNYRTMRNRFPKGLKWMTKVAMDRGF
jgi:Domain of unknown function (DUF4157)